MTVSAAKPEEKRLGWFVPTAVDQAESCVKPAAEGRNLARMPNPQHSETERLDHGPNWLKHTEDGLLLGECRLSSLPGEFLANRFLADRDNRDIVSGYWVPTSLIRVKDWSNCMMRRIGVFLFALSSVCLAGSVRAGEVVQIDYEGFSVWVDCDLRGPVLFHYVAEADSGTEDRLNDYHIDPDVDVSCQSLSTDTFQSVLDDNDPKFDVGHQAPANHFDGSELAIAQTNFWTNLLPQTKSMNRGAWLRTEEIIECIRDEVPLEIWGGPIWGNNFDDDFFLESHGISTPSAFWKVVIRSDNRTGIAWIIPNGQAPKSSIDKWLESIELVERVTGRQFDATNKSEILVESWPAPSNCNP